MYWLMDFLVSSMGTPRKNYDLSFEAVCSRVILQSIGIIVLKSKETRVVIYT